MVYKQASHQLLLKIIFCLLWCCHKACPGGSLHIQEGVQVPFWQVLCILEHFIPPAGGLFTNKTLNQGDTSHRNVDLTRSIPPSGGRTSLAIPALSIYHNINANFPIFVSQKTPASTVNSPDIGLNNSLCGSLTPGITRLLEIALFDAPRCSFIPNY